MQFLGSWLVCVSSCFRLLSITLSPLQHQSQRFKTQIPKKAPMWFFPSDPGQSLQTRSHRQSWGPITPVHCSFSSLQLYPSFSKCKHYFRHIETQLFQSRKKSGRRFRLFKQDLPVTDFLFLYFLLTKWPKYIVFSKPPNLFNSTFLAFDVLKFFRT